MKKSAAKKATAKSATSAFPVRYKAVMPSEPPRPVRNLAALKAMTDQFVVRFMVVTPAIAAEWLKHTRINRRLRGPVRDKYARQMRTDWWGLSSDAIMRTKDGQVINGQHRLAAIVSSNTEQYMMVIENVDEALYKSQDQGYVRTVADATGLAKFAGPTIKYALFGPKQSITTCEYKLLAECMPLLETLGKEHMRRELTILHTAMEGADMALFPSSIRAVFLRALLTPKYKSRMVTFLKEWATGLGIKSPVMSQFRQTLLVGRKTNTPKLTHIGDSTRKVYYYQMSRIVLHWMGDAAPPQLSKPLPMILPDLLPFVPPVATKIDLMMQPRA